MKKCSIILLKFNILFFFLNTFAKDGDLDPTFGTGGLVITDFGSFDFGQSIAIQPDGKIVAAGYTASGTKPYNFALARYTPTGILDSGFGSGGLVITDFGSFTDIGQSIAIQPDGKIVVAGYTTAIPNLNNFAIDPANFALARYTPTGTLDSGFGSGGIVITDFGSDDSGNSVAIQSDGKIIVAGSTASGPNLYNFALARYTPIGTLDSGFGSGGLVITDFGSFFDIGQSIAIQPDGKIVAAGYTASGPNPNNFALARYTPTGILDSGFGSGGLVITDFGADDDSGNSVAIQPDGKIVVAGYTTAIPNLNNFANDPANFALARYTPTGTLDSGFGSGGIVITDFGEDDSGNSVAIQSDGKIVVAGSTASGPNPINFALARYTPTGILDSGFGSEGLVITDFGSFDIGNSIAIQPDGKIVAAGYTGSGPNLINFALARYLSTLPTPPTPTPPTPDCPLPLPKGKISKLFIALRAKYGIFCPCNTQST